MKNNKLERCYNFVRNLKLDSSAIDKSLGHLANCYEYSRQFKDIDAFQYPLRYSEIIMDFFPKGLRGKY